MQWGTRGPRHTRGRGSCVAGKPGEHELCGLELIDCGSVLVVCNPGFRFQLADIYTR